jgi:hypothetical protein
MMKRPSGFLELLRGRGISLLAYIFLSAGLFLSAVQAQMRGLSTEELTRGSSLVVVGDVEEVESYWSEDGKRILSRATVLVREVVRGKTTENRISVEYPGGEIDGLGMKVSDVAPLTRGEKVLLFLSEKKKRRMGEAHSIIGKAQGKYTIEKDGTARKKGFSIAERPEVVEDRLPLEELIKKVRAIDEKDQR